MTQFFEDNGFHFVGQDIDGERMEIVELDGIFIFFYSINTPSINFLISKLEEF